MMDQAAAVMASKSPSSSSSFSTEETSLCAAAASSSGVTGSQQHQRFAVLSYEQVNRLDSVMDAVVPIHGRGNFPTLEIKLKELVQVVRAKLERDGVKVRDIRVNGGAASYILAADGAQQPYNDLDLIFAVDLSTQRHFERVKTAVLESLLDFLPEGANKKRISSCSLKEAYVHKMVKVTTEGDRWSLISLSNHGGRNVELKFVDTMRRQFEFSVDSFQIVLDSLLVFYECAEMPMADNFYPTVVGESVYGDFHESLYHLNAKLISTRNPEEIRGGGLLKYCNLLVRGYKAVSAQEIKSLERYMCSRFFIDFSDLQQQQHKLENYLTNHFGLWSLDGGDSSSSLSGEGFTVREDDDGGGDEELDRETATGRERCLTYDYLMTLHRVVDESTVCLMNHERRQTLNLIEEFACQVYFQEQHRLYQKQQHHSTSTTSSSCSTSFNPMHHHHYANAFFYAPFVPPPPHHHPHSNHHHHYPYSQHHYTWMPCA